MVELHNLSVTRLRREGLKPVRFLTRDEEAAIFAAIQRQSERYFDLSIFLVDTGARLGEALTLGWTAVTLNHLTFERGKPLVARVIPITHRATIAVQRQSTDRLGPFSDVKPHDYRAAWNVAKQEAGISDPTVVPTVLRHTCAVRLIQGGIDLRTVQKWLGHQTLAMTMRYAQYASSDLEACVRVLERSPVGPS